MIEEKINILQLLSNLEDYVIIKKSLIFPDYNLYDDVDIMNINNDKNIKILENDFNELHNPDFKLVKHLDRDHTHIDIYYKGMSRLNIRFDFLQESPFTCFELEPTFINDSISRRIKLDNIYVPEEIDEMLYRLFEYLQYPLKKRHLDYVKSRTNQLSEFYNRIEQYTNLDIKRIKNLIE